MLSASGSMQSLCLAVSVLSLFLSLVSSFAPPSIPTRAGTNARTSCHLFGPTAAKIPSSPSDRDNQAISAVKAAIASPKIASFPLLECEFPPLQALNKLGDGSLRSAKEAELANLAFATKLAKSISPVPFLGPNCLLVTSSAASNGLYSNAVKKVGGGSVHSLKDGLPDDVGKGDVCILVTPSTRSDYQAAETLASSGNAAAVVIINGFAKDQKSVSASATMGYFLKPLTYNSQVAGYLIRSYPGKWTTIDAVTNEVLGTAADDEILVKKTNTPDLRRSGKLVQKSVDDRAIRARRG